MDWGLYWTLIGQILLAILILTLPVAIFVFMIATAIESGSRRPTRNAEQAKVIRR